MRGPSRVWGCIVFDMTQEFDEPSLTLGQLQRIAPAGDDPWVRPAILAKSTAPYAAISMMPVTKGQVVGKVTVARDGLAPFQAIEKTPAGEVPVLVVPFVIANGSDGVDEPVLGHADISFAIHGALSLEEVALVVAGIDSDARRVGWRSTVTGTQDGRGLDVTLTFSGVLRPGAITGGTLRVALTPGTMLVGRTIAFSISARTVEGRDMKSAEAVATVVA